MTATRRGPCCTWELGWTVEAILIHREHRLGESHIRRVSSDAAINVVYPSLLYPTTALEVHRKRNQTVYTAARMATTVIENRGPQLLAVDVFFMTMAIVTTLLRCYVRLFLVKTWGKDDWFMLIATVSVFELHRWSCLTNIFCFRSLSPYLVHFR